MFILIDGGTVIGEATIIQKKGHYAIVEVNGHRIVVDTDHVQLIKKMKG